MILLRGFATKMEAAWTAISDFAMSRAEVVPQGVV